MRQEVKIGIFLTGTLLLLALLIFYVGDFSRLFKKQGYDISVFFSSTTGLDSGAPVRLAGVKIGYVKDILLVERKAKVVMSIFPKFQIPKGSKAALTTVGLLGERFLEISPSDAADYYQPGDILEAAPVLTFDQLGAMAASIGEEIKELSKSLREITGGESKANLEKTLQNLRDFSLDLSKFMAENRSDLREGIHGVSQTAQQLDKKFEEISKNVNETVDVIKGIAQDNKENIKFSVDKLKELVLKLEESVRSLSESLDKINKGEGTLGKLIQNPKLYNDAEKTITAVQKTVAPLGQVRATGSLRGDYLAESEGVKSYINVGLSLSSKYNFWAQVVQNPQQREFTYSAQGGIRFGGFVPRAGIIESEIGAGIDYLTLNDRLAFSLDCYDFQREGGPHLRFTSQFSLIKYMYLVLGVDDFSQPSFRQVFFGLGLGTR
jgi:phospholipid/cholesterol/gamma-HCH transport system substrate-binding protein